MARFPYERSFGGRLTLTMDEFSAFINSCNLIGPPLEGARFTWSSHEEVLALSQIDRFFYSIDWEDHFQGSIKFSFPRLRLIMFLFFYMWVISSATRRPFKFENVWLEVEGFSVQVQGWWNELSISGSPSFILAKKLNFLKMKLKDWNKGVFST